MEVAEVESERVEPSAALLEVHRCMADMVISAGGMQAVGGGALDYQEHFVFVESLKGWVDTGGGSIATLDDLFGLEPMLVLQEDPTLDVLMHFYGMFDAVNALERGAECVEGTFSAYHVPVLRVLKPRLCHLGEAAL